MARIAQITFESQIRVVHQEPVDGVAWDFVSGRTELSYQGKTIMWSIFAVFTSLNLRHYWGESSWVTRMGSEAIGVGKVYLGMPGETAGFNESTIQISEDDKSDSPFIATSQNASSWSASPGLISQSSMSVRPRLSLELSFVRGGHIFSSERVYRLSMLLLLDSAVHDSLQTAESLLRYDPNEDFSMAISAYHVEDPSDWKWWMVNDALWMFPRSMSREGQSGRFAEGLATIKTASGAKVGKMLCLKGMLPPAELTSAFAIASERTNGTSLSIVDNLPPIQAEPVEVS